MSDPATMHDLQRAICCPSGKCVQPEDCSMGKRNTVVDIPRAAEAVSRLLCQKWREESMNVDQERWR